MIRQSSVLEMGVMAVLMHAILCWRAPDGQRARGMIMDVAPDLARSRNG
jgi:hypothetical protein